MYLDISLREDKAMVDNWNQDAKSILLFSGLFSASVAAALGPGLPDLFPSQPDLSVYFLQGIYVAVSTGTQNITFDPIDLPSLFPPSLTPYRLVNSLWYSSLVISLTCALLAILLQQWARQYLMAVQQQGTPHNRARIRGFLAEGIRDSRIVLLVDAMWASHQLSFLLFTLGLLVYFRNTDDATFFVILTWSILWICLYLWLSIAGIFRSNSPYHTPLSSLMHRLPVTRFTKVPMSPYTLTRYSTQAAVSDRVEEILRTRKEIEDLAQTRLQGHDGDTLKWTFKSLYQDHEFERFFAGIPDFCSSRAVINPAGLLRELNGDEQKLSQALIGLMHRTVTSHLISEPTRRQRINICTRAIDAVPDLVSWSTLRSVFGEWDGLLESVDSGDAILHMGGNRKGDPRTAFCARCIVAVVIARGQVYGDRWLGLTSQFLTSDMEVWYSHCATVFFRLLCTRSGMESRGPLSVVTWGTVIVRCLPTSFSLLGSSSDFTPSTRRTCYSTSHPGLSAKCCPILTCGLRLRRCSASIVACGTTSSRWRRMVRVLTRRRSLQKSSDVFARATSRYTRARTLH
ncbi:hypothetical protein EDB85DRAFT_1954261 [Lactarius pseudohatsudake]|nr:hypothetical protein EDB85DRAFT_1954261 [Lactarius pseudohatsudake]